MRTTIAAPLAALALVLLSLGTGRTTIECRGEPGAVDCTVREGFLFDAFHRTRVARLVHRALLHDRASDGDFLYRPVLETDGGLVALEWGAANFGVPRMKRLVDSINDGLVDRTRAGFRVSSNKGNLLGVLGAALAALALALVARVPLPSLVRPGPWSTAPDLTRLPVHFGNGFRRPPALALLLVFAGLLWLFWNVHEARETGHWSTNELLFPLLLGQLGHFLFRRTETILDPEQVVSRKRGLLGNREWSEPMSGYEGLVLEETPTDQAPKGAEGLRRLVLRHRIRRKRDVPFPLPRLSRVAARATAEKLASLLRTRLLDPAASIPASAEPPGYLVVERGAGGSRLLLPAARVRAILAIGFLFGTVGATGVLSAAASLRHGWWGLLPLGLALFPLGFGALLVLGYAFAREAIELTPTHLRHYGLLLRWTKVEDEYPLAEIDGLELVTVLRNGRETTPVRVSCGGKHMDLAPMAGREAQAWVYRYLATRLGSRVTARTSSPSA